MISDSVTRQCNEVTLIMIDNQSAIKLIRNPQLNLLEFYSRTKHIDVRYYFIREKLAKQSFEIDIKYIAELIS